jgi:repressor LexA
MTLGNIIKSYRQENGMSMDAFSSRSGISKAYISLLEKNKHPKTGKPIAPSIQCIKQAADGMNMDFNELFAMLDGDVSLVLGDKAELGSKKIQRTNTYRIPVLGRVAAGVPIKAVTDIRDWEEVTKEMFESNEYFALQIHGDSMEPRMYEGDVVIVKQQPDAESGEIVIATVNGDDATCKRLVKYADSIALVSLNTKYEPMIFSKEDIERKPVRIIGKVVELRGKF